jgi:hypothetical protein
MASLGDWIKVEKSTARKPEILRIAAELDIHPDHAFGMCIRFFMWVDDNLSRFSRDICHTNRATIVALDQLICHTGFTQALINAGWLRIENGKIEVPNFDRHMSQGSKTRAENSRRQAESRRKRESELCHKNARQMSHEKRDQIEIEIEIENKKEAPIITPQKKRGRKPIRSSNSDAEKIYDAYPRKVGRPKAIQAITKALLTISSEELLRLTEEYAKARQGEDQQFTPHPATWFGQERFRDAASTWKSPQARQRDMFSGIRQIQEELDNGGPDAPSGVFASDGVLGGGDTAGTITRNDQGLSPHAW